MKPILFSAVNHFFEPQRSLWDKASNRTFHNSSGAIRALSYSIAILSLGILPAIVRAISDINSFLEERKQSQTRMGQIKKFMNIQINHLQTSLARAQSAVQKATSKTCLGAKNHKLLTATIIASAVAPLGATIYFTRTPSVPSTTPEVRPQAPLTLPPAAPQAKIPTPTPSPLAKPKGLSKTTADIGFGILVSLGAVLGIVTTRPSKAISAQLVPPAAVAKPCRSQKRQQRLKKLKQRL